MSDNCPNCGKDYSRPVCSHCGWGNVNGGSERERVHVVCDYMRKVRGERGPCKECPSVIDTEGYGPGKQMCRGLAEEIMSIVIRGSAYPPRWESPTAGGES